MTIYYNQWKDENGTLTFTFDDQVLPVEDGFNVMENHPVAKEFLNIWLSQDSFLGTDGEMHNLADEPILFLSDFIPRVCGFKSDLKEAKNLKEIEYG